MVTCAPTRPCTRWSERRKPARVRPASSPASAYSNESLPSRSAVGAAPSGRYDAGGPGASCPRGSSARIGTRQVLHTVTQHVDVVGLLENGQSIGAAGEHHVVDRRAVSGRNDVAGCMTGRQGAQLSNDLAATEGGHPEIADHHVERLAARYLDRVRAVWCRHHGVTTSGEVAGDDIQNGHLVID